MFDGPGFGIIEDMLGTFRINQSAGDETQDEQGRDNKNRVMYIQTPFLNIVLTDGMLGYEPVIE